MISNHYEDEEHDEEQIHLCEKFIHTVISTLTQILLRHKKIHLQIYYP